MTYFMTRVELLAKEGKKVDESEYAILREEMTKKQFHQSLSTLDNTTYHLPAAEYVKTIADIDRTTILDEVKSACEATKNQCDTIDNYRILITEGIAVSVFNLKKVESRINTGYNEK